MKLALCSLICLQITLVACEIIDTVNGDVPVGDFDDSSIVTDGKSPECHLRPVVHILQHDGCIPKPIASFACFGSCTSYVQVSNSKFWQVERSCNCCQEIGEREASVTLHCPKQSPKHRKIITRAPVDCLCRPCTAVDELQIQPQEIHDMSSG